MVDKREYERVENAMRRTLCAQFKLNLEEQAAEELAEAIHDKTGKVLECNEECFTRAQMVFERMVAIDTRRNPTDSGKILYNSRIPPLPFRRFAKDILRDFERRFFHVDMLTLEDQQTQNIQDITKKQRQRVNVIVDEMGVRNLLRKAGEDQASQLIVNLKEALTFPNIQWAVRPPKVQTENDEAYYRILQAVVLFSRIPRDKPEGVRHGDEIDQLSASYMIETGDRVSHALLEKEKIHRDLRTHGRGNNYLKFILDLIN